MIGFGLGLAASKHLGLMEGKPPENHEWLTDEAGTPLTTASATGLAGLYVPQED